MTASLQELKTAACELPHEDRASLAQFLLRSLDEGELDEVRAEWLTLAEARMAEVRAGRVAGVPAEEVLRTIGSQKR